MDVIQAQNIGEISNGATANFIMDLIGYSPALVEILDGAGDFTDFRVEGPICPMPSTTPKKRNRPLDDFDHNIQTGISKRQCNSNSTSTISASKFSDPKDLFLNTSPDKDKEDNGSLFLIRRPYDTNTIDTSALTQPNRESPDHENNSGAEFIEMPDSPHTPNSPPTSSFLQLSQMCSGLSYTDKIALFNRLLDGLIEDSDSIIENGKRIIRYAESMKGILTKSKAKLELEAKCPYSSTHGNGYACICSANTHDSVINSPMFSKFFDLNSHTECNTKINPKGSVIATHEGFGLNGEGGAGGSIARVQSLRPELKECLPLRPRDFKNPPQEQKIKVPRKEEKLLKQAIREILLPVDELAVLVSKRYENLKEDKPLCPMEPKTVELILRQYGYVICED
ncbi:hypothetical protein AA313_de0207474 [Arthrobotrys entomopaga]|nr:hypothetical protein AA313_de0207474 [Arthrobotrys entomopaga]